MDSEHNFILENNTVMRPYTADIAAYCSPFVCLDNDLDEFFRKDAFLYENELLGKTYAWINTSDPRKIMALITLANDSVKAKFLTNAARNRVQRSITNAKRGLNYPAVLIGRLGVASDYQGSNYKIGSQVLNFIKGWFCSSDNKTGCRFIVVDAYNNPQTLHFYEKNGFKPLYKSEREEREFLELTETEPLETRFLFFDLKRQ